MAAIVGITKQTSIADLLHDAAIVGRVLQPHDAPFVHTQISWYVDPESEAVGQSDTVRFVRIEEDTELDPDEMSYENPMVEGDDAGYGDAIEFTTDSAECTGRIIGIKRKLSYQGQKIGLLPLQRIFDASKITVQKRIARDQSALALTVDNLGDHSGIYLTRQIFGREKALAENQQPHGRLVFVATSGQLESLKEDIRPSAASLHFTENELAEMFKSGGVYRGTLEDIPLFVNFYAEEYDAANDFGFFTTVGEGGALGIANFWSNEMPEEGITGGFKYELEWLPDLDTFVLWTKAYVGHAITDQANIRGLVSRKLLV